MPTGLLGSSKPAKKTVQVQPYQPSDVLVYAPVKGQLQKNANRQNSLNNGKVIEAARKNTEQSGGAFFLKQAQQLSKTKIPSVTGTSSTAKTPPAKSAKSTPDSAQGTVVVPQFKANSHTPVSSTDIAQHTIETQYKQHVQASTDSGAQVGTLGNAQTSGGRRKKRRTRRKKRGPARKRKTRQRKQSHRTR